MNNSMPGLIAYGSLMSVAELERLELRAADVFSVTVAGFRRSFSQEPSWRKGTGNRRGVLTVAINDQASLNAILISDVPGPVFAALDHRERGYDRVCVPQSQIRAFEDTERDTNQSEVFIYIGKPDHVNSELEPNPDYLNLCVNAACDWGDRFRDAFLETTFVSETPLIVYAKGAR